MSLDALEGEIGGIGDEEREQLIPGLTISQRIQGFALFFSIALFSSFLSWIALGMGSMWKFTFLSSFGTMLSLLSTFMLMGPSSQLQYMMDNERRTASLMYIGSVLLSFMIAILYQSTFLCLISTLLQYSCLGWYSLSYIPYGREMVCSALFSRRWSWVAKREGKRKRKKYLFLNCCSTLGIWKHINHHTTNS